jgi:hypothetical protein
VRQHQLSGGFQVVVLPELLRELLFFLRRQHRQPVDAEMYASRLPSDGTTAQGLASANAVVPEAPMVEDIPETPLLVEY